MVVQFKVLFYHRLSTLNNATKPKGRKQHKEINNYKNLLLIKMKMISQNVT